VCTLTKQNEIDAFRAYVAAQPRGSYLAAILKGADAYVEGQIRNDFAFPIAGHLRELEIDAGNKADELKQLQKEIYAATEKLRLLESKIGYAKQALEKVADAARGVLRFAA
jgi:hypothetical protein